MVARTLGSCRIEKRGGSSVNTEPSSFSFLAMLARKLVAHSRAGSLAAGPQHGGDRLGVLAGEEGGEVGQGGRRAGALRPQVQHRRHDQLLGGAVWTARQPLPAYKTVLANFSAHGSSVTWSCHGYPSAALLRRFLVVAMSVQGLFVGGVILPALRGPEDVVDLNQVLCP